MAHPGRVPARGRDHALPDDLRGLPAAAGESGRCRCCGTCRPDLHPRQRDGQRRVPARGRAARHRHRGTRHQPARAGRADEPDNWQFGCGAGFYVDATQAPYDRNYRMWSYVTEELRPSSPASSRSTWSARASSVTRWAATAHSPSRSPIPSASARAAPSRRSSSLRPPAGRSPPLTKYLGADEAAWRRPRRHRADRGRPPLPEFLVDQGTADSSSTRACALAPGGGVPRRPESVSPSTCARATTTPTSSSRPSWTTTSPGPPSACAEPRGARARRDPGGAIRRPDQNRSPAVLRPSPARAMVERGGHEHVTRWLDRPARHAAARLIAFEIKDKITRRTSSGCRRSPTGDDGARHDRHAADHVALRGLRARRPVRRRYATGVMARSVAHIRHYVVVGARRPSPGR